MKKFAYPDPSRSANTFRLSLMEHLICAWETRKIRARRRREDDAGGVEVFPLRGRIRPLKQSDLPLIVLTHNDRRFVRSFLKHYRDLGVTRFLCVDDQSSDGTREMLHAQDDVDVFFSNVRYRDARRGRLWREALLEMHGPERWYLNVDSDEYLVFQDCENRSLRDLIGALEAKGVQHCPAPMIDAYPAGELEKSGFDGETEAMPWHTASMIDGPGYRLQQNKRALSLRGGARERVFGVDIELMKYPLLFWRQNSSLGISIHEPLAYQLNFAPIFGVLLHFKIFGDIAEVAAEAVKDGQYFDGAKAYARILDTMKADRIVSLEAEVSTPYRSSRDLVDRGFIAPVFS